MIFRGTALIRKKKKVNLDMKKCIMLLIMRVKYINIKILKLYEYKIHCYCYRNIIAAATKEKHD